MSSRLASAQALVTLLTGIQDSATSQSLYGKVKLGALIDPTGYDTWAEVVHFQGQGGPAGSGGSMMGWRIDDTIRFMVTSGVGPYEADSEAAQEAMLNIQDVLLPAIREHFLLPQANNAGLAVEGVYSVLVEQMDRSRPPARFPNGKIYLLWDCFVTVKQQYEVTLVEP